MPPIRNERGRALLAYASRALAWFEGIWTRTLAAARKISSHSLRRAALGGSPLICATGIAAMMAALVLVNGTSLRLF